MLSEKEVKEIINNYNLQLGNLSFYCLIIFKEIISKDYDDLKKKIIENEKKYSLLSVRIQELEKINKTIAIEKEELNIRNERLASELKEKQNIIDHFILKKENYENIQEKEMNLKDVHKLFLIKFY